MTKLSLQIKWIGYVAGFFAALAILLAASAGSGAEHPAWPHEQSDLAPDPAVVYGRLPNGFRYILMRNSNPKDRVSLHLVVQAGSLHERPDQRGVAHYLEHMMFRGTTHFPPGEIVKYFQSLGMQFGPDVNAHTGFSETVYDLLLPDGSLESLEKGFTVLLDYAGGALLLQSEIDQERGVILSEKRTRDSVSYRTYEATVAFEFPESLVSRRLPIGTTEILETAGRDLLKDYYDTWYRPDRLIVVMVGDFDTDAAEELLARMFGSLAARRAARPEPVIGPVDHRGLKPFYHFEKEAGNTNVTIEILRLAPGSSDSLEERKKRIIEEIAGRIVHHRLEGMLSSPRTPFTDAGAGSGVFEKDVKYAYISAETDPERWAATLEILEQTLRGALTFGFREDEISRVKKEFLARLRTAAEKAATRQSVALARKLIMTLNSNEVFLSPQQEQRLFADFISALTAEDIYRGFLRLWDVGHRLVLVTGNADLTAGPQPPAERIVSVYKKSRATPVAPEKGVKSTVFPYLPVPEKSGRIVSRKVLSDPGAVQVDFENGVALNVMATDFKSKEVLVDIVFGPGRAGEPLNRPGLALLAEAVVNESGLGRLDRRELDRALAGTSTTVSFNIAEDGFHFTGESVTDELELLFQLLHAHVTDPGYRESAYDLTMKRFEQQYRAFSRSIDGRVRLEVDRFLAGGDTRFGWPPWEEFKKSSLADVRQWIDPVLKNAPLEISVVGDVDVQAVVDTAARYFGGLSPRTAAAPARATAPSFPAGRKLEKAVDTKIDKGVVILAYPTVDIWDIHRTRRLSVLADIFSERLRQRIREKLGATYSPFAYNRPSRAYRGYGVLRAMIHVDPAQSRLVTDEVRRIADDLATGGVAPDELQRSVEPLLTGIRDMRQTNRYWLQTVLSGSRAHPSQIEWSRDILDDYASITPADIAEAAKTFLRNDAAATVLVRPVADMKKN